MGLVQSTGNPHLSENSSGGGGSGTVTSVSVTTANGVSGSVATATTTPAISLTLGAITPTTVNGLTITSSTGTLTVANGKTATVSNTLTLTGTDSSSVAFGTGGTVAYTADKLSAFAATTSAELAGVISDETGSGKLVFGTAPTFASSIAIGTAASATGSILINGTTSGTVTLSTADAAGTWTMKLPTSAGSNTNLLQTDGSGNTSWVAAPTSFAWGTTITGSSGTGITLNATSTGSALLTDVATGSGTAIAATSSALGGGGVLSNFTHTASGTLTANTTTQNTHSTSRTHTAATTVTDNFIDNTFSRTNVVNNAGGTFISTGSVVNISGSDTQTAGAMNPAYNLLSLVPGLRSTGSSVNMAVPNSIAVAPTNGHFYGVLGNTQTVVSTLMKLDTGTSTLADLQALNIASIQLSGGTALSGAMILNCYSSATEPVGAGTIGYGLHMGRNYNTSSSKEYADIFIEVGDNGSSGKNTGLYIEQSNQQADWSSSTTRGAGISVLSTSNGTSAGVAIAARGANDSLTATNGLVNFSLTNTQSGASVIQKIDTGTSSQAHTGLLINLFNASTTASALKIAQSTTGTGYGINMTAAANSTGTFALYNNTSTDNYIFRSFSPNTDGVSQAFSGECNVSANISARSADFFYVAHSRINEAGAGTVADNYNLAHFKRTNRQQTAGGTLTSAGAVVYIENIATQTAGTLTDTVDGLLISQDVDSTGAILKLQQGSTTKFSVLGDGSITTTPLIGAAVGFLNVPSNSQSAAYTTVAADSGKSIDHPSTDANARTFTIDSNANVAYPIGTCISFSNMTANVVTIAITSDTMYLAGTGTTGSRSLAQYGTATARKLTSTTWLISGNGLT